MRGARAARMFLVAALTLLGCVGAAAPVVVAQPNSFDATAHGKSHAIAPAPRVGESWL
jgi:hypothetical protein